VTIVRTLTWFLAAALGGALGPVLASGAGMMHPSMPQQQTMPQAETAAQKAALLYNQGVKLTRKADDARRSADTATDAGKKSKATQEAQEKYTAARAQFEQAVQIDPGMPEAWNYLGYTNRKLGSYDQALVSYDKALALKPNYPDAIEYRGEAYLGMSHLPDAKQAYLDLYASDRKLAQKLLDSMNAWVAAQRAAAGGPPSGIDDFEQWIREREQIAHATAALTRAGTAAAWR
jgi:tetratricopeptide (TPR) repeat protein